MASEAEVTKQCIDFLRVTGWTCLRLNSGVFQRPGSQARVKIGEKGQPDWLCLKALPHTSCLAFFLEFKRTGESATKNQLLYHAGLKKRGFATAVIDDLEKLQKFLYSWAGDISYAGNIQQGAE